MQRKSQTNEVQSISEQKKNEMIEKLTEAKLSERDD